MKCGFPFLSLLDADEVVAVLEVDFVEIFLSANSFNCLIDVWEEVTIGNRDFVDCSIFNAQA